MNFSLQTLRLAPFQPRELCVPCCTEPCVCLRPSKPRSVLSDVCCIAHSYQMLSKYEFLAATKGRESEWLAVGIPDLLPGAGL